MVRVARRLALVIAFLSAACSEPPNKEMNLAQGAIEAARAAGAERFATAELTAAVDTLKKSNEAAASNDYRQALNHALDSFERAQNAAKVAVEGRANARGEAERAVAQVATLLATAETQIKASPLPARNLAAPRTDDRRCRKGLARSARRAAEGRLPGGRPGARRRRGRTSGRLDANRQARNPSTGAPQALGHLPGDRSYRDHEAGGSLRFLIRLRKGLRATAPSARRRPLQPIRSGTRRRPSTPRAECRPER